MYTNRAGKIENLEEMLNADVYFLVHNRRSDGSIDGTMIDVLRKMIRFTKRREKATLVIQTPGGYADEAYYIGEFFREYYDETEAYVVSDCYSGGTMIALSTDRIYLSHSGCLGPIDIQRYYMGEGKEENWYPAPSGLIEALIKARENDDLDEDLERTFRGKMSVLATYFKDKYTYADLVGENVKRHCLPGKDWNEVWKYLSALNFSHGTPLTYRRLKEIGLKVELMDDDVEEAIKVVIRDVEHEFGDLVEKDYLYDFFKNPQKFSTIGQDGEDETDDEPSKRSGTDKKEADEAKRRDNKAGKDPKDMHQYITSTNSEKLAVIETSIMGFMQSREVGIMIEDFIPSYMTVISSGWEEEVNMSEVSLEDKEKLDTIVSFYAIVSGGAMGVDLDALDEDTRQMILATTYSQLQAMAIEAITDAGYIVEDIPNSEVCKMVVSYLTHSPNVICFDDKTEELLRAFAEVNDVDYDTVDGVTKLEMYDEFCLLCEEMMLMQLGVSEDEFYELPEEEQANMLNEFMANAKIRFEQDQDQED